MDTSVAKGCICRSPERQIPPFATEGSTQWRSPPSGSRLPTSHSGDAGNCRRGCGLNPLMSSVLAQQPAKNQPPKAGWVLGQCRRWWPDTGPALGWCTARMSGGRGLARRFFLLRDRSEETGSTVRRSTFYVADGTPRKNSGPAYYNVDENILVFFNIVLLLYIKMEIKIIDLVICWCS